MHNTFAQIEGFYEKKKRLSRQLGDLYLGKQI